MLILLKIVKVENDDMGEQIGDFNLMLATKF